LTTVRGDKKVIKKFEQNKILTQLVFIVSKPYLWLSFPDGEKQDISDSGGNQQ
jgi:hypothetical protein